MAFPTAPVQDQIYGKWIYQSGTWKVLDEIIEYGNNFNRYSNGILVQWGTFKLNSGEMIITFPKLFNSCNYTITFDGGDCFSTIFVKNSAEYKKRNSIKVAVSRIDGTPVTNIFTYRAIGNWANFNSLTSNKLFK